MTTPSFEELSTKVREHERQEAVILNSMSQLIVLLNPGGDLLEVNRDALVGAGHREAARYPFESEHGEIAKEAYV